MLTLLDRLSRRGAVSRRKEGRGFRYQPAIERDKLRRMALGQFLDHHFGGSVHTLRLFLETEPVELKPEPAALDGNAEGGCVHDTPRATSLS